MSVKFLRSLTYRERIGNFYDLISSDALYGKYLSYLCNLRKQFFSEWESALFLCSENGKKNLSFFWLMAFHLCRKKEFLSSNDCLVAWLSVNQSSDNDIARWVKRNYFLAGEKNGINNFNWKLVEPIFRNSLSIASYSMQNSFAMCSNNSFPMDDVNYFLENLDNFRTDLRLLKNIESRPGLKQVCEELRRAKSIAIIGKGDSLLGQSLGDVIDSYDIVVRVNHTPKADQLADFGHKTSVVIHAAHLSGSYFKEECAKIKSEPMVVLLDANRSYHKGKNDTNPPEDYYLDYLIESITYRRATTGLRAIVLLSLIFEIAVDITAFGFDFYTSSSEDNKFDGATRNSAAMAHEIDYEFWFARQVLPKISKLRHFIRND